VFGLLIVEDEEAIKRKLMSNVAWEDYGFAPVLGASNGVEALELLERNAIDLMVTDIQMPVMNGIELIKEVKKRNYPMKIIVISGFAEFEYARESIKLAVSEYLLKPFATKRLLEVALRLQAELKKERAKELELAALRAQLNKNLPVLREKFLTDLLHGKGVTADFQARLAFLQLAAYERRPFQVVVMELHDPAGQTVQEEDKYLLDLQFYEYVEGVFKASSYPCLLLNYYQHQIVVIAFDPDQNFPLRLEEYLEKIRSYFNKDLTFGVSNCYRKLADLSVAYKEACVALQYSYVYGLNRVFAVRDLNLDHPNYHKSFFQLYHNQIFDHLRIGAYNEALDALERFFAELRTSGLSPETIRILAANLLLLTCATLNELGYDLSAFFPDGDPPLRLINQSQSLDQLEEFFKDLYARINQVTIEKRDSANRLRVDEIRRYLEENYAAEISLSALAEKYKISPGYLSLLFAEHTGKKFTDYLTECRIAKAKELLKHTDLRIYEVASAVGYNDPYYFSNCFKKLTNQTPSEYREKIREGGNH